MERTINLLEPGRSIIGNAGILISKVEYIKEAGDKKFAIVDTGMNDLIRPSLYEAWHGVMELENRKLKVKNMILQAQYGNGRCLSY